MSSAEAFPFLSHDARRAFGADDYARRIARIADWTQGGRILELGGAGGSTGLALARDCGCSVVVVDQDEAALGALRERVRALGLTERVDVRQAPFDALPFGDGEFNGVVVQGRVPFKAEDAAQRLRRLLGPSGKLVLSYPVRVGRHPARPLLDLWEKRLGEALLLPRELLQLLERNGYEPQSVETLSDAELDDLYRSVEPNLSKLEETRAAQLREEIEAHRSQGSKSGVSLALAVGRRKEAGERPPASRDRG